MPKTKKIKITKNIFLGFGVLVLLFVFILSIKENLKMSAKRKRLNTELQILEQQQARLLRQKQNASQMILDNNREKYLETSAREKFNLKKPGETVVAFPVVETKASPKLRTKEEQNLWQKIMNKIR